MSLLKMMFGALVAAVAMFVAGLLLYATPVARIGYGGFGDTKGAAIQAALARNSGETGTYVVPDPSTQAGSIAFATGPVALVHVQQQGGTQDIRSVMIRGFIQQYLVCFILGWALMGIDRRVPDYISRFKTVLLFAVATSAFIHLGTPIWFHLGWRFFIFRFVADALILTLAGAILARWFLPVSAIMPGEPGAR